MEENIQIRQFIRKKWIKHWAGRWHLLNNSLLGYQYTKLLKSRLGKGLKVAVFISHKHYTVAYLDYKYYKAFGSYLVKKILGNRKQLKYWTNQLIKKTDNILSLTRKLRMQKEVTDFDFQKFVDAFYAYGVPHRVIKIVVDALPPKKLKEFLPLLSKARVYAEPVYAETESFIEYVALQIANVTSYNKDHLLYITKEEIDNYWESGKLPNKKVLAKRFNRCAILYQRGRFQLVDGKESNFLEGAIENKVSGGNELNGFVAYPGKARGIARIVLNPNKVKIFNTGDILVTGMTRPEYLPLVKKSSGFVTDAGGILSHAAITARELKKPCIIGTQTATKVLKDGDMIEVNSEKGIVEIIKRKK